MNEPEVHATTWMDLEAILGENKSILRKQLDSAKSSVHCPPSPLFDNWP